MSATRDSSDAAQTPAPTFWLGSTEITGWSLPRACFVLGPINGPIATDFLLVGLDPPSQDGLSRVALAPRYKGESLSPVTAWSLTVNIFVVPSSAGIGDTLGSEDVRLQAVGEIYRSRTEAASAGAFEDTTRGGRPRPRPRPRDD